MERKEIACEQCGALYFAEDIPSSLTCTCKGTNFAFTAAEQVAA